MDDEAPIRISLAHASEQGMARLRALVEAVPAKGGFARGGRRFLDHAVPTIEEGTLIVPRGCARETWAALFQSKDPRALAVAFRLFTDIQQRGWVEGLWRSGWSGGDGATHSGDAGGPAIARRMDAKAPSPDRGSPPPRSVA